MRVAVLVVVVAVSGCASGAQPNIIQRAKVLSANDLSITIEHSELGKLVAFRMADEHCAKLKRSAVYRGGSMQLGPDMTSTWRCE